MLRLYMGKVAGALSVAPLVMSLMTPTAMAASDGVTFKELNFSVGGNAQPSNNNHSTPIGAATGFKFSVLCNGRPAPVTESAWLLNGSVINPSTIQSTAQGLPLLMPNPVIAGDPDSIVAAWAVPGTYGITINAVTASPCGRVSGAGTITIVAPAYNNVTVEHYQQPTYEGDTESMFTHFVASANFTGNAVTAGGTAGFVQIARGLTVRMGTTVSGAPVVQCNGQRVSFLDSLDNSIFYKSAALHIETQNIQMEDIPTAKLLRKDGGTTYVLYQYLSDDGDKVSFNTYVAYKAPIDGARAIVNSYYVGVRVIPWDAGFVVTYVDDSWDEVSQTGGAIVTGGGQWSLLPAWTLSTGTVHNYRKHNC